jgi:hypothetical protein
MGDGQEHDRVRRGLIRVINDDNLDLYALGAAALVFTVLGITGITDAKTTSAVVIALLALLAFSQIKSRRLIEQIRNASRGGANALFAREFPSDLATRRVQAHDILLIGEAMPRMTLHGMQADMAAVLAAGGRIRVLVYNPIDEALVEVANRRLYRTPGSGVLKERILATLHSMAVLRERAGGRLEIRVSSTLAPAGFTCLDTLDRRGVVYVQHYEYQPNGEAAPVFPLTADDGAWYQHFVDEAERLWAAGTDWPLSPEARAARAPRPVFSDEFGPELEAAVEGTSDLLVTGVARNIFVNNNYRRMEKKLLAGERIRFLLVDPDSPAIAMAADRYHPKRTPEGYHERIEHTLRLLAELKASTGGDLSVRLTPHLISMFQIVTDDALFAEYYIYQDLAKPKFVLTAGDGAYEQFRTEAVKLWDNATVHDL